MTSPQPYVFRTSLASYQVRPDMVESLKAYVATGRPVGGFLRAVLAHDLAEACARADHWNMDALPAFAAYMYNEMPHACHGSYEAVDRWVELGGLEGLALKRETEEENETDTAT